MHRQGGDDDIDITPTLSTPRRITCVQGSSPVVDNPAYTSIAVKAVYPRPRRAAMEQIWKRIFKGADSTTEPNVCKDRTNDRPPGVAPDPPGSLRPRHLQPYRAGPASTRPSARTRPATNSRPTTQPPTPHLVVYALSGRGAE